jgi:hypothetical protein
VNQEPQRGPNADPESEPEPPDAEKEGARKANQAQLFEAMPAPLLPPRLRHPE